MSPFEKLVLSGMLALGAGLGLAPQADAEWTVMSAQKPDLKVVWVAPSPTPNYVRVYLTNNAPVTAPACWVRIDMNVPHSYASTRMAPAIAPYGAGYVDVHASYSPKKPGQVTKATIDYYDDVAEKNEWNNVGYYVAPPG